MKLLLHSRNTVIRQVVSIMLQVGAIAIIARGLGVEQNGIYAIAVLLPLTLSTLLALGLNTSIIYHINNKDYSDSEVFSNSLIIYLFIAFVGLLFGFVLVLLWGISVFPSVDRTLLYKSLLIFPFHLLFSTLLAFLQAKSLFNAFNIGSIINSVVLFLLSVVYYIIGGFTVELTIYIHLISAVISSISVYLFVSHYSFKFSYKLVSICKIRVLLSFGLRSHLSDIIAFLNYRSDIFLLNLLSTPASVGIYHVGIQIVERVWIISSAVSSVVFPKFVALNKASEEKNRLVCTTFRAVVLLTLFIALGLLVFGYYFITWVFGMEFEQAFMVIIILLPGVVLGAGSRILANAIASDGRPEINAYTSFLTLLVNILLNVYWIPMYGFQGAAAATSVSYLLNTLLRVFLYSRFTKGFKLYDLLSFQLEFKYIHRRVRKSHD